MLAYMAPVCQKTIFLVTGRSQSQFSANRHFSTTPDGQVIVRRPCSVCSHVTVPYKLSFYYYYYYSHTCACQCTM